MNKETIAVLLSVYNKDKSDYLRLSINSILSQSYSDFIIYIGVDGPINDDLKSILLCFSGHPKVNIIYYKKNRGLASVLNDLLEQAFSDGIIFFARMDADDISLPDRLKLQIEYLITHPKIDVVGGAITEINEAGEARNKNIYYPTEPDDCRAFFSKRNPHAHPAVMFRKSFFDKIGHGYRPEYRQNQDTMLWLDGFSNLTLNANLSEIILKFRMTDSLFKHRRNGWEFAKKQFTDRLMINRKLKYGITADIFGFAMFLLQLSPTWMRKIAYKILR